ncbi:EamA family transporter [Candidatus Methylacidiphilum infernorum]|nr:EamA family transporter [Candidatus Methylacidiphilum infernorum]
MAAILLPLLASMIQPVGFLLIKKGTNKPLEAFQAALITNIFFALLSLPFLFFTPKSNWGLPLVAAVLSALGQVLLFLSVINCEVSVITPIMGSKVLFIALMDWIFLGHQFEPKLAVAILFSLLGFFLLVKPSPKEAVVKSSKKSKELVFAVGCSLLFAGSDLVIQQASHEPLSTFLLAMYLFCGIVSLPFLTFVPLLGKESPFFSFSLFSGSFIQGLQGLGVALGILFSANATQTNILYNLRGIWSVFIVWALGFLIKTEEGSRQTAVFFKRLVAALCFLISAVVTLL